MSTNAARPEPRADEATTARKFLFERSFDPANTSLPPHRQKQAEPTYTAQQLEAEKKQAYDNGVAAGKRAMAEDLQKQANAVLSKIDQNLASLFANADALAQEQTLHARDVAYALARKIVPAFVERYGMEEIESLVTQVLNESGREPRLVVRVGAANFETISERISALAQQKAYAGKIVVLAEDGLGPSDCRIEWADGGLERDVATLWKRVEQIMSVAFVPPPPDVPEPDAAPISTSLQASTTEASATSCSEAFESAAPDVVTSALANDAQNSGETP